ncbi:MAG TPA: ABC transporter substrate-binding protein [Candidatus Binatus sp.]|uniref:ABC transporter substrate-binding protein n=1 Tax=Candidatus Binatus sp. TaxID=2811406 RepID=UPI002B4633D8|nr:ABC transporter substrate-binding protein [Candidatus Binatus sp.]HKN11858.1 ABC transporter substrate-binding protein [Candidatus Binatus sp.]
MKITIGLSLSLTGEYSPMGRQAEIAIRLFVADANASSALRVAGERCEFALECHDDASDTARCAEIYRSLCANRRAGVIFGPYSNRLARVAAPIVEQSGRVFVNHGGAGDELYERGYKLIVGVLSPASDYLSGFVRLLTQLKLWRKRVAIVVSKSPFARAVASGFERAADERAARRRGVRVRVKWNGAFDPETTPARLFPALTRNRVNALASAGSYEHDVAVMRAVAESRLNIPVLGCVAAGVGRFASDLGELADGIVGPSQWEDSVELEPALGPTPAEFARRIRAAGADDTPDYPAAQIYAAGLLTAAALASAGHPDDAMLRAAFSDLRTTTMFGDFAIDRITGCQVGHQMLLVQWHRGRKVIIAPESHDDSGSLDFPAGWRLLLAGAEALRLSRPDDSQESLDDEDPGADEDERNHD